MSSVRDRHRHGFQEPSHGTAVLNAFEETAAGLMRSADGAARQRGERRGYLLDAHQEPVLHDALDTGSVVDVQERIPGRDDQIGKVAWIKGTEIPIKP